MLAISAVPEEVADYDQAMKSHLQCITCQTVLVGRQRRFCCRRCKNADTNHRHQSYASQQARGLERKLRLLAESGSCCRHCGYSRNLAALTWHHVEPKAKSFALDMRSMSNRSEGEIRAELVKCIVLCANCHAELHFPQLDVSNASSCRAST